MGGVNAIILPWLSLITKLKSVIQVKSRNMFKATSICYQYHIQTAVIGAGVVGLSVARALSKHCNHEVLLLEQSNTIGSGISSRNSEVIHAGIYYDMPFKSRFCVEGKKLLYQYCQERDIQVRQCGKILVASSSEQRDVGLPKLVEYAKKNGVYDLQILSKEEVAEYEPRVSCTGGVLSPSTGIVDSHSLMTSLLANAEESGTTLALHCQIIGGRIIPINSEEKGSIVLVDSDGSEIACDNVIIAGGLASDKLASAIISSCPAPATIGNSKLASSPQIPRQYHAKGNYFKLENQKSPFSRLIYPLPDPKGGLGVHATIDLGGSTRFGPDVEWLDCNVTNLEDIDMDVDPKRADLFYAAIRKYWPELEDGNLVPDYSGIRPKLLHPDVVESLNNNQLKDFMIAGPKYHGIKGLTVLLGIESPGLTSSLAIGNYIANTLD